MEGASGDASWPRPAVVVANAILAPGMIYVTRRLVPETHIQPPTCGRGFRPFWWEPSERRVSEIFLVEAHGVIRGERL